MTKVTIYTTIFCPYCMAAKSLLNKKGVDYEEIDVSGDFQLRQTMTERSNGCRTVPQIFIGEQHVGGYDDMSALDRAGRLDPLLQA